MSVGHTILFYVAITAFMFIALDGLVESDHFSIAEHSSPTENDDIDADPENAKKTLLETHYAIVCAFFRFTDLAPRFLTHSATRFPSITIARRRAHLAIGTGSTADFISLEGQSSCMTLARAMD